MNQPLAQVALITKCAILLPKWSIMGGVMKLPINIVMGNTEAEIILRSTINNMYSSITTI